MRMRMWKAAVVLGATLALVGGLVTAAGANAGRNRGLVTLCFAPAALPHAEHTVHVPQPAADRLVARTASYRGACAAYGESAARGHGRVTAYSQGERGVPTAVGMVFPSSTLTGLPWNPPSDGKWCYDKNDDGTVNPMRECANGYGDRLRLAPRFTRTVDSPLKYLLVNWNPRGHGPPNVYGLPHFDVHFYLQSNARRLAIRPGPCPELVNCGDYRLGKKLPAAKYRPADFVDLDAQAPAMGNHLIDTTGPEFNGARFTHTFIYGTWNRKVTFYEPMVTREWFAGLLDGTRDDACFAVKSPQAYQQSGWYPTRYCLRYRENRDELTVSLERFVHRRAA